MATSRLFDNYMEPLLGGRRRECRELVRSELDKGASARDLYHNLVWPAMARVEEMYRNDSINIASEHMATRINRTVADQLQSQLSRNDCIGKRIIITCAEGEAEEFSAQMSADLFEAEGWEVFFLGGGVPQDEIGLLVGHLQPNLLLILGSKPTDAPLVRTLIDYIREIGAAPTMNVMVSGGVFNRASELWKEVKADLFAETASEALGIANDAAPRIPQPRVLGVPKKRRRRRRPPLLAQCETNA